MKNASRAPGKIGSSGLLFFVTDKHMIFLEVQHGQTFPSAGFLCHIYHTSRLCVSDRRLSKTLGWFSTDIFSHVVGQPLLDCPHSIRQFWYFYYNSVVHLSSKWTLSSRKYYAMTYHEVMFTSWYVIKFS